jgi:hypothetical protein
MKNKIVKTFIITLSIGLLSGCVKESYAEPLTEECVEPSIVTNRTVPNLYAASTSTPVQIATDDIIEAYVVSSDEGGNFFKTISLVSTDLGNTRGFSISIDAYNLYNEKYEPGKKVYVKLKDLYNTIQTGGTIGLVLGGKPYGAFNTLERIPAYNFKKIIVPTCVKVDEETLVKHITLSSLNNNLLNTLVEFDNVQFTDTFAGGTYDPNTTDTSDTDTYITNGTSQLVVRTSRYANFAGATIPTGNGKIRGVLTKYNSTYQLVLRTERDVKLTNTRVVLPSSPLGGAAVVFNNTLVEPFTSFSTTTTSFPAYINDQTAGGRYWGVKNYSGNNFIEMTSFGGGGVTAKSFFMVPVDFTAANTFAFKKLVRYNKGEVLKVFYVKSADYVAGYLNPFVFVDITSSFTLTYPAIDASESSFTSSGTYNIPASLTGTGYFVFQYAGTPTLTTTMQIDDITIN